MEQIETEGPIDEKHGDVITRFGVTPSGTVLAKVTSNGSPPLRTRSPRKSGRGRCRTERRRESRSQRSRSSRRRSNGRGQAGHGRVACAQGRDEAARRVGGAAMRSTPRMKSASPKERQKLLENARLPLERTGLRVGSLGLRAWRRGGRFRWLDEGLSFGERWDGSSRAAGRWRPRRSQPRARSCVHRTRRSAFCVERAAQEGGPVETRQRCVELAADDATPRRTPSASSRRRACRAQRALSPRRATLSWCSDRRFRSFRRSS